MATIVGVLTADLTNVRGWCLSMLSNAFDQQTHQSNDRQQRRASEGTMSWSSITLWLRWCVPKAAGPVVSENLYRSFIDCSSESFRGVLLQASRRVMGSRCEAENALRWSRALASRSFPYSPMFQEVLRTGDRDRVSFRFIRLPEYIRPGTWHYHLQLSNNSKLNFSRNPYGVPWRSHESRRHGGERYSANVVITTTSQAQGQDQPNL